jgi:hypothetical protein
VLVSNQVVRVSFFFSFFDHTSNVSDHADNASPLLCYKGRQIDDTDLLGLSTKLFGLLALTTSRNNTRREERRYDNRDHCWVF